MLVRGGGELVDYFEIQCNSDLVDFLKQRVDEDEYVYILHRYVWVLECVM